MLESFFCLLWEFVLANKSFEKSNQLILWDVAAIRFWKEGEMSDSAICVEVEVDPQFDTFDIKIEIGSIILYIHQKFTPAFIGKIDVVVKH